MKDLQDIEISKLIYDTGDIASIPTRLKWLTIDILTIVFIFWIAVELKDSMFFQVFAVLVITILSCPAIDWLFMILHTIGNLHMYQVEARESISMTSFLQQALSSERYKDIKINILRLRSFILVTDKQALLVIQVPTDFGDIKELDERVLNRVALHMSKMLRMRTSSFDDYFEKGFYKYSAFKIQFLRK